jgi:hypothetical protein
MIWNRELWYEWAAMLLAQQWERPLDADWDEFRAEWFRALFDDGRSAGFVEYAKR